MWYRHSCCSGSSAEEAVSYGPTTWEGVIIVVEEAEAMDVRSGRLSITSIQFMDRECNYP